MRQITMYVSPYQTELAPLRELIFKCMPYGFGVERNVERTGSYRIVVVNEYDDAIRALTEYMTLHKLLLWIGGFVEGIEYEQNNKSKTIR